MCWIIRVRNHDSFCMTVSRNPVIWINLSLPSPYWTSAPVTTCIATWHNFSFGYSPPNLRLASCNAFDYVLLVGRITDVPLFLVGMTYCAAVEYSPGPCDRSIYRLVLSLHAIWVSVSCGSRLFLQEKRWIALIGNPKCCFDRFWIEIIYWVPPCKGSYRWVVWPFVVLYRFSFCRLFSNCFRPKSLILLHLFFQIIDLFNFYRFQQQLNVALLMDLLSSL